MRIALGLEYDGSRFHGWQTQPGGNTVQDTVEAALAQINGGPVSVTCAGRTDSGVHACEQIVHLDTAAERPDTAWVRGVNGFLPEAVAVLWARRVPADFHARYSARSRAYRYVLVSRPVRPALAARYTGWTHAPLDLAAMRAAAAHLLGEHDFSAFRSSECQARTPVRFVHEVTLEQRGERIDFVLRANAFLHHMVRNIVGTLVHVGKGARGPEWVLEVLRSRHRRLAAGTFGPEGLYLESIDYGSSWELPSRPRGVVALPLEA
jgi:tRNA pseudouridine38-40 synthase